jgi:hypothetical protein
MRPRLLLAVCLTAAALVAPIGARISSAVADTAENTTGAAKVSVFASVPGRGAVPLAGTASPDGGFTPSVLSVPASAGAAHGEVLLQTGSATLIGGLSGRRALLIQNLGPNDIAICPNSSCTFGNGIIVKANGGTAARDVSEAIAYYGITTSSNQVAGAGVRYEEIK